ncbi:MAG: phosphatase PAP2 family protein [Planctomycetota bacterium]
MTETQSHPADVSSPDISSDGKNPLDSRHYSFIDYATQIYLVLLAALIAFGGQEVANRWWLLAGHGLAMIAVHALIRSYAAHTSNRVIKLLRHFYPVLFYIAFYRETGELNQIFIDGYLDEVFISMDAALFGGQPSINLMSRFPMTWVSELFYISYFSYYVMIVGVGLALYAQSTRKCFHYVSVVSFMFYVCFLIYIIFPVVGARVFWEPVAGIPQEEMFGFYPLPFPDTVRAGPFFHVMDFVYENFQALGAAFPSSHVAVALATLYFSWKELPRVRHLHCVMVILLCIATVYCRYHYVVDIYAGAVTGVVLLFVGDRLFRRFQEGG